MENDFVVIKRFGKLAAYKLPYDLKELVLVNKKITQIYIKSDSIIYIDIRANGIRTCRNVIFNCPMCEKINMSDNPIDDEEEDIIDRLREFRLFSFKKFIYNDIVIDRDELIY